MGNTENLVGLRLTQVAWIEDQYPKARCEHNRYAFIGKWPLFDAEAMEHYVDTAAFEKTSDGSFVATAAETLPVIKAVRGEPVVDPITRIRRRRWTVHYLDMPFDDVCAMALLAGTADVPEGRGVQVLADAKAASEASDEEGIDLDEAEEILEDLLANIPTQVGDIVTDEIGLIMPDSIPNYLLQLAGPID